MAKAQVAPTQLARSASPGKNSSVTQPKLPNAQSPRRWVKLQDEGNFVGAWRRLDMRGPKPPAQLLSAKCRKQSTRCPATLHPAKPMAVPSVKSRAQVQPSLAAKGSAEAAAYPGRQSLARSLKSRFKPSRRQRPMTPDTQASAEVEGNPTGRNLRRAMWGQFSTCQQSPRMIQAVRTTAQKVVCPAVRGRAPGG